MSGAPTVDLASYEPKGDKQNSCFFHDNLARVYERRSQSGLTQLVGAMESVVIQVDHGDGLAYMAELALMGPYRFWECWLNETHRIHLLEADPLWPRLILLEPLNISFVYPDEASNDFYALPHLTFTFLSDYTYNRVGYVDVPLDSLAVLELGDRVLLDAESLELLEAAGLKHQRHGLAGRVLGIDHLASRVLAGEREDALLEYLTMVPDSFWGACNIAAMNSSTNVTRHPSIGDEKQSPARVFTEDFVVERCLGYDGFFTRDNVAALTAAAGEAERYQHGHVFD